MWTTQRRLEIYSSNPQSYQTLHEAQKYAELLLERSSMLRKVFEHVEVLAICTGNRKLWKRVSKTQIFPQVRLLTIVLGGSRLFRRIDHAAAGLEWLQNVQLPSIETLVIRCDGISHIEHGDFPAWCEAISKATGGKLRHLILLVFVKFSRPTDVEPLLPRLESLLIRKCMSEISPKPVLSLSLPCSSR